MLSETIIDAILDSYSVRRNEFSKTAGGYWRSKSPKALYTITIEEEIAQWNGAPTGRILVKHTNSKKEVVFTDTWLLDNENNPQFFSRNASDEPVCDAIIISETQQKLTEIQNIMHNLLPGIMPVSKLSLKQQLEELQENYDIQFEYLKRLEKRYHKLLAVKDTDFKKNPLYLQMFSEITKLRQRLDESTDLLNYRDNSENKLRLRIQELAMENQRLKNDYHKLINDNEAMKAQMKSLQKQGDTNRVHNARGAGRKRNSEAYRKGIQLFAELYHDGKTAEEIMEIMQIGQATYYRYRKRMNECMNIKQNDQVGKEQHE